MYDLLEHSEGLIGHGDGFVNVNGLSTSDTSYDERLMANVFVVTFRMVVFRPFKGEVLLGRISSKSSQHGIKCMCISKGKYYIYGTDKI